jgi:glycerol-3-phosphate dehydrogenase (NAD(P)+)
VSRRVAVLGAGSWGTALSIHLGRLGHDVRLWARDPATVRDMTARRANAVYVPDVLLPASVTPTERIEDAVGGTNLVIVAVPSHGCRAVLAAVSGHLSSDAVIVSAVKGLESGTLLRMSEVIEQETGGRHRVVVLSGPSFALEVAQGLPTAVLVASEDHEVLEHVQSELRGPSFRLYGSPDVIGVELCGALKNVIAIAAGVVEGVGLGHNALAALITRGLAEIARLTTAAGGKRETPAGLSGLGDLVLTCTGSLSRNRHVGIELARGRQLADIVAGMKMVAEGVRTTGVALALAARFDVELPIATQMSAVLDGRTDVRAGVEALMLRRQRAEAESPS